MLFIISLDLGSIILPWVCLSDINSLLCGWFKSDDGYGDGGGEYDIICFLPITGSSRSSTQPYGKSGRMEETTIFLWERLRLQ